MIFLAYFLVLYGSVAVYAFVSVGSPTSAPQSPLYGVCGALVLLVGIPQIITHFIDDPLDLTGIALLTIMLDAGEEFVSFTTDAVPKECISILRGERKRDLFTAVGAGDRVDACVGQGGVEAGIDQTGDKQR